MAYIPAPNIAQVECIYLSGGERVENVYHVESADGWTAGELQALAEQFVAWETDTASPLRNAYTALVEVRAFDLTTQHGAVHTASPNPPIIGTADGEPAPNNVTIAVNWHTEARGRGRQGRSFWIGLSESQISGNFLAAGVPTAIVAAYQTLLDNLETVADHIMVVLHKRVNGVPLATATFSIITSVGLRDGTLDSQRTRLPNHRRRRRPSTP
jgi:hypothetical protein